VRIPVRGTGNVELWIGEPQLSDRLTREMAALCHRRGVPVAIDGAHAPGQIALDVARLGVDWYVGNLHKWAFAAKGTAVIWCAAERQPQLHPTAISHYLRQGFTAEFDYAGTRDNSAWLAAPAALDYVDGLGAAAMRAHNAALARDAGAMLAEAWDSEAAAAPEFGVDGHGLRSASRGAGEGRRPILPRGWRADASPPASRCSTAGYGSAFRRKSTRSAITRPAIGKTLGRNTLIR
jgi:hypothetical protein